MSRLACRCACSACCVECASCRSVVGYHVLVPCELCAASEHNSHFWLFHSANVDAAESGVRWSALPYNGAAANNEGEPAGDEPDADAEREVCCICAACPLWRPTRIAGCPPSHRFCFGCISREVDARKVCPLDRRPITRADLIEEPQTCAPAMPDG